MPFLSRVKTSWSLMKTSLSVLGRCPSLLLFPIIMAAGVAGLMMFSVVPVVFQSTGHSVRSPEHWSAVTKSIVSAESLPAVERSPGASRPAPPVKFKGTFLAALAVGYFVLLFLVTLWNVAFYHEIMEALRGQEVSLGRGIRFALGKWPAVLGWSLLAGVVGLVLKQVEEKFGFVGQWVIRLIGMAWSVASVFAIPVLVMEEETSPVAVLRKSAERLKQTWGESLAGYAGLSLGGGILLLGGVAATLGAVAAGGALGRPGWALGGGLVGTVVVFGTAYILSVAGHVFRAALYVYAVEGQAPGPFTGESLAEGWKIKPS
jgi:hypothetical protein